MLNKYLKSTIKFMAESFRERVQEDVTLHAFRTRGLRQRA